MDIEEEIVYIVGRHWWAYKFVLLKAIVSIMIVYYLYQFIHTVFGGNIAINICWTIWLALYIWVTVSFFDIYLDNVLLTPTSIIIFKWFGFFKNTIDVVTYEAIESLFQTQDGILDLLFDKWNLIIRRQWHENKFEHIPHAWKTIKEMNDIIHKYKNPQEELEDEIEKDDFQLFLETMWEIIREYQAKKNSENYEN